MRSFAVPACLTLCLGCIAAAAQAEAPRIGAGASSQPLQRDQPVTFTADQLRYDRDGSVITATGHVEAWQNDHVLRADTVTFDRNTNVATASGHVVLLEPDGEVLFSDRAELSQGMRDGVLHGMQALLAQNGKLAANGARRTDGKINELTRAVYSPCDLCKTDPTAPPLWQIQAFSAVHDTERKRIEFEDAVLQMYGIPVAYSPYFSMSDPSVKRQSGFLMPSIGNNSRIGTFATVPYYWVLDRSADATITPTVDSKGEPQVDVIYRQRFNNGNVRVNVAGAYNQQSFQGLIFADGQFALNDTWRYGFNIQEATSANYLRDFRLQGYGQNVLASQIYLEGFGQGAYSRVDTRFYKGLVGTVDDNKLPYVLPRYQYSFLGEPDRFGGRLALDAGAFNVLRAQGTNTQRASTTVDWTVPATGRLGDQWHFSLHADSAAYNATSLDQAPNYSLLAHSSTAQAIPAAVARVNWPFLRTESLGQQLIEPIAQVVVRPNNGASGFLHIPNEDSLDALFTTSNLFALNRYPGIDRLEGGNRADLALHGNWTLGGTSLDGLVGQSYRQHTAQNFYLPLSGLTDDVSDVVARATLTPASWLDLTYRTRIDHKNYHTRFADAVAGIGPERLKVSLGYLYSSTDPYYLLDTAPGIRPGAPLPASYFIPRNEVTVGVSSRQGHWKVGGYARRDLQTSAMVAVGASGSYENECFIGAVNFFRLFTNYNGESNVTALTVNLTFKTLGQFSFPAM